jgi:hypothetical protein
MATWHRCATTHCIAGWAVHLAGPEGYKLEKSLVDLGGAGTAGAILLGVEAASKFRISDDAARNWLRSKLAGAQ